MGYRSLTPEEQENPSRRTDKDRWYVPTGFRGSVEFFSPVRAFSAAYSSRGSCIAADTLGISDGAKYTLQTEKVGLGLWHGVSILPLVPDEM
jgi:hypothetical protein